MPVPHRTHISVLIPCTSKGRDMWTDIKSTYLYNMTVKTLLMTQNDCYDYTFYVGYDTGDRIFSDPAAHAEISRLSAVFKNMRFQFIEMEGVVKGHVTAMWNILFQHAYDAGCDYFYQCGDDIVFHTKGWTRDCIATLESHDGYGLAGPINNNARILTQAFVSRRHMEVFGFFFPEEIINWCCDDWYNEVYHPTHLFPLHTHYCTNNGGDPRYTINNDPTYEADAANKTMRLRQETSVIAQCDRKVLLDAVHAFTHTHHRRISIAKQQMKALSVVVCGCTKNSSSYISRNLESLYAMKSLFGEFRMIVYENDSIDGTVAELDRFGETRPEFTLISETNVQILHPSLQARPQYIAHGRNRLLEAVEGITRSPPQYMFMVDLDSVLDGFVAESVATLFTYPENTWDGLFANCAGKYYDVWALRVPPEIWNPGIHGMLWREPIAYDCWEMAERTRDVKRYVHDNQVVIPSTNRNLIPVGSAFGGFGVYRTSAINGCRYGAVVGGMLRCEHVAFHRDMCTKHGGRLAICTDFVVAAQPEHVS